MDRRANRVPGEYARVAKDMEQGPVTRRLQEVGPVIPLVFGGFAEVSEGVHTMVDLLSKFRLKRRGCQLGGEDQKEDWEKWSGKFGEDCPWQR